MTQRLRDVEAYKIVPPITVGQLLDCLRNVPRDRRVLVVFAEENEINATCVTIDRQYVRICDKNTEISRIETVLLDTASEG